MGINQNIMSKIKRALISVSDKENLKPLLSLLKKHKIEILSSGGTYRKIRDLKFKATEISDFTNSPEILDGRVKTLHPKIHGGILNKRNNKKHSKELKKNDIKNIDLVIVNFYPFEKVVKKKFKHKNIIENIDIGGPSMVRAAAKNYQYVTVITAIKQYDDLIYELTKNKGSTTLEFRKKLSLDAFSETAYYDSLITNYLNQYNSSYFPTKKIFHSKHSMI